MNSLIKEIIKRSIIGLILGVFLIMTIGIITILINGHSQQLDTQFFIQQYIGGGLLGVVFSLLNLVFSNERLSLFKATLIHFTIINIAFYMVGVNVGWIGNTDVSMWIPISSMLITYALIWIISYLIWGKNLKEINDSLSMRYGNND